MSPTINAINIDGYRFFFYSNEGEDVHVHVKTPDGTEIEWWLGKDGAGAVSLKQDGGVKSKHKRDSKRYVENHYDTIVEAWNSHFEQHRSAGADVFVYGIEPEGFWLYAEQELYWVGFDRYPVFRYATDEDLIDFEYDATADHFYWPAVDADLSLEMLRHPDRYPLRARHERERDGSPRHR